MHLNEVPSPAAAAHPIPILVLTGFLGAGKSTLLNRFLASPLSRETVVMINEFGDVGIDDRLVRTVDQDVLLLESGCLCCAMKGDFIRTLRALHEKHERGEVPPFRRVVVETSGLADPVPVVLALHDEQRSASPYGQVTIVTVVDATAVPVDIERHPEAVSQIVVADRIHLSKRDLATSAERAAITMLIARLNPTVAIEDARTADEAFALFSSPASEDRSGPPAPTRSLQVTSAGERRTLPAKDRSPRGSDIPNQIANRSKLHKAHGSAGTVRRHGAGWQSFTLHFPNAVPLPALEAALRSIVVDHAGRLVRLKGFVLDAHSQEWIVIQAVRERFHLSQPLDVDGHRATKIGGGRIVFICEDLEAREQATIERQLATFGGGLFVCRED